MIRLTALLITLLISGNVTLRAADSDPLATLKPGHPRLLATAAEFDAAAKTTDPLGAEVVKRVLATAEANMNAAPLTYKIVPGDAHLLSTSRAALKRIVLFSMAYRLSHDVRFANHAKQDMITVSGFPDWSPPHFLDTAEMSMAVSLGYDWCFDTLSPDEKKTIKTALTEKALSFGPAAYGPLALGAKRDKPVWWVNVNHNWNQVCNDGLIAAALAIGDEEPDAARLVLKGAKADLPQAMHSYAPEGAWPEGPGYWAYGTTYNVLGLAMLQSALGTDFGLSQVEPAFAKTAAYRLQMEGPTNMLFNYADASTEPKKMYTPAFGWLAQRYGPPVAVQHLRDFLTAQFAATPPDKEGDGYFAWFALWLPPAPPQPVTPAPLDVHFIGAADIAIFRSAWNDPDALYLGFKTGTNGVNHGHLDLGTFVLDSDHVRWASELGADSYNLPQYFGALRPTYFRHQQSQPERAYPRHADSGTQGRRTDLRVQFDAQCCLSLRRSDGRLSRRSAENLARHILP